MDDGAIEPDANLRKDSAAFCKKPETDHRLGLPDGKPKRHSHHTDERTERLMRRCKLCRYSRICNDLPGICILLPYVAIAVVTVALGYLFITQELI